MSTSPMGANKPIEDIEATLLAATKSALDELVWWAVRSDGRAAVLSTCWTSLVCAAAQTIDVQLSGL